LRGSLGERLTCGGNFGGCCSNPFCRFSKVFRHNALGVDRSSKLARDPAGRNDLRNHKKSMQEDDAERCLVVENRGRQPYSEDHMVQSNGCAREQQMGKT
jgi:hypothetical protein